MKVLTYETKCIRAWNKMRSWVDSATAGPSNGTRRVHGTTIALWIRSFSMKTGRLKLGHRNSATQSKTRPIVLPCVVGRPPAAGVVDWGNQRMPDNCNNQCMRNQCLTCLIARARANNSFLTVRISVRAPVMALVLVKRGSSGSELLDCCRRWCVIC